MISSESIAALSFFRSATGRHDLADKLAAEMRTNTAIIASQENEISQLHDDILTKNEVIDELSLRLAQLQVAHDRKGPIKRLFAWWNSARRRSHFG